MTGEPDFSTLQVAIVQMDGKMNTMLEVIKAGDRESQASIKLVTGTVDNLSHILQDLRKDNKESFARMYNRLEAHTNDEAPHAASQLIKDMRNEIDTLKTRANVAVGAVGVLMFIGLPGIAAIIKLGGG